MIVFDLKCSHAHIFEAWFGSSADYEGQNERGLIACPACGDTGITKAVMAPAVAAKGNRAGNRGTGGSTTASADDDCAAALTATPAARDDGFGALLAAQRRMEAASDYVGSNFAARARAIHEGTEAAAGIYGEATGAEAAALIRDGIAVLPLPFRPLIRSDA